ncbi:MAG TPA: DUF3000 domain-containing protein [Candidatus Stackebrandtia faecavium]|nr:DUF3000 domain-containing protein [Candidatus Stackebrandtia faecavium]
MTWRNDPTPVVFRRAVTRIRSWRPRSHMRVSELPAPRFLAPYSHGISATVGLQDTQATEAHLVLLHDPQGQPSWEGVFRLVTYVGTHTDEPWQSIGYWQTQMWVNLTEALHARGAAYRAAGGTVTCTSSQSCGGLATDETARDGKANLSAAYNGSHSGTQIQLRASWTPPDCEVSHHLDAWESLIMLASRVAGTRYQ